MSVVNFSDLAQQRRIMVAANKVGTLLQREKLSWAEALDALICVLGFALDNGAVDRKGALDYVVHMLGACKSCADDAQKSIANIPDEEFYRA